MNPKILRALIREIIQEDVGSVSVSTSTRSKKKKSWASRAGSAAGSLWKGYVGLFSADESNADEEILDEDEEDECDE
jgi:hypothetical protein